ncbi:MAG: DUF402 domain-containing protein [Erysipelotrichaceae bacterium]|jgi:protein associated with RNAse G/E
MYPEKNSSVYIQSFKHDGSLNRTWDQGFVLESDERHYVIVTNKTWVIEKDGRKWFTREPAIGYFYTDRWFNVMAMIRSDGIYYYCNLASPVLYDGEAVKYIDYDLDFKIFSDNTIMILDEDEYARHSESMSYPEEIDFIIKKEMHRIMEDVEKQIKPFNRQYVENHFQQYLEQLTNQ